MKTKKIRILMLPVITLLMILTFSICAFAKTVYITNDGYEVEADSSLVAAVLEIDNNGNVTSVTGASENYGSYTDKVNAYQNSTGTDNGSSSDGNASTTEDYGLAGDLLDKIFGSQTGDANSIVGNIMNPFKLLAESGDIVISVISELMHEPFYYEFQAIAITLTVFYYLTSLVTKDLSQNFGKPTIEMIVKPSARFVLVIIFIMCASDLCKFFLMLSQLALSQVIQLGVSTSLGSGAADMTATIMDSLGWQATSGLSMGKKMVASISNFAITLRVFVGFILPFIASIVCNVGAVFITLTRTVNLIIHSLMAPLALSDLYGDHDFKDSRAFGFLKKYFGLCMQSSVIVLAYYVTNRVCGNFMTQILDKAGGSLSFAQMMDLGLYVAVLKIVQIGAVISSARKAQEVVSG